MVSLIFGLQSCHESMTTEAYRTHIHLPGGAAGGITEERAQGCWPGGMQVRGQEETACAQSWLGHLQEEVAGGHRTPGLTGAGGHHSGLLVQRRALKGWEIGPRAQVGVSNI